MLTFDSFTLIPTYSDIESRSEVDISTNIFGKISEIPVINANMLAVCSEEMIKVLDEHNTFSSYHRFFNSRENRSKTLFGLKQYKDKMFISVGTKENEYDYVSMLHEIGFKNFIVDVNHGHHKMVEKMIRHIHDNHKVYNGSEDMIIIAGNVSSTDGINFLADAGADIVKIGNSFGFSCTTIKQTGFGSHPIDTAYKYHEYRTNNDISNERMNVKICVDGGVRDVSDIAKSLIFGDIVMLGRMFAGCTESFGPIVIEDGIKKRQYFGNASIKTKQVVDEENHVRHIEGTTKLVPHTGPISDTLKSIKEGLQSAFSFVGARNIKEYQERAKNQIILI